MCTKYMSWVCIGNSEVRNFKEYVILKSLEIIINDSIYWHVWKAVYWDNLSNSY